MRQRQTLPDLWLISDERNDHVLEVALRAFSRPIAFVYRHYFLAKAERRQRFMELRRLARRQGHLIILAGDAPTARRWRADGHYGPPASQYPRREGLLSIATAHNPGEIAAANRAGAHAIMLSPVFPTRSHPGARPLGPTRFRLMATLSRVPVIALGGMDQQYAQRMRWPRWAAIDGLSTGEPRPDF